MSGKRFKRTNGADCQASRTSTMRPKASSSRPTRRERATSPGSAMASAPSPESPDSSEVAAWSGRNPLGNGRLLGRGRGSSRQGNRGDGHRRDGGDAGERADEGTSSTTSQGMKKHGSVQNGARHRSCRPLCTQRTVPEDGRTDELGLIRLRSAPTPSCEAPRPTWRRERTFKRYVVPCRRSIITI